MQRLPNPNSFFGRLSRLRRSFSRIKIWNLQPSDADSEEYNANSSSHNTNNENEELRRRYVLEREKSTQTFVNTSITTTTTATTKDTSQNCYSRSCNEADIAVYDLEFFAGNDFDGERLYSLTRRGGDDIEYFL